MFRSPERALSRAFVLLVVSSTVYFGSVNEADNDLWMHLFVGRLIWEAGRVPRQDGLSYTAAGQAWIDHEWLAQLLAFGVFEVAGPAGLIFAKLLLVSAMVWFIWRGIAQVLNQETRSHSPPHARDDLVALAQTPAWVWGPIMVLVLAVLARGLSFRPQLWTYAFLPVLLWLLGHPMGSLWWRLCATFLLFLAWVNLHGGFVVGLAVIALFTLWGMVTRAPDRTPRALLAAAALLATLCNPYGWRLFPYLMDELGRSHPISEWQPVAWFEPEHGAFSLLLGTWMATLPWLPRRQGEWWRVLIAFFTAWFAVRHQRHVPVFALCVAAPFAVQWLRFGHWLAKKGIRFSAPAMTVIGVAVCVLAAWQVGVTLQGRFVRDRLQIVFAEQDYPVRLVAALREAGSEGNLAVPLDWGGYALWHLAPRMRLSLDGRFATVYPEQVVQDNFAFYRGGPGWTRLLDAYPTEAVLLAASARHPLQDLPDWIQVASDRTGALWVRRNVIERFRVQLPEADAGTRVRAGWLAFP